MTHKGREDGHRVRRWEEPVFCREQYSCDSPSIIDTVGILAVQCIYKVLLVLLKHLYRQNTSLILTLQTACHFKWVELLVKAERGSGKGDCGILMHTYSYMYVLALVFVTCCEWQNQNAVVWSVTCALSPTVRHKAAVTPLVWFVCCSYQDAYSAHLLNTLWISIVI
jgi:hypothetical protein